MSGRAHHVCSVLEARIKQLIVEHRLSPVGHQVREQGLTYLQPERLYALQAFAGAVNQDRIKGDFVEMGIALGGSAVMLASLMPPERCFHGYDLFGMIPRRATRTHPKRTRGTP